MVVSLVVSCTGYRVLSPLVLMIHSLTHLLFYRYLDLEVPGDRLELSPSLGRVRPLSQGSPLGLVGWDPVGVGVDRVVLGLVPVCVLPLLLVPDSLGQLGGRLSPEVVESGVVVGGQCPVVHWLGSLQVQALLAGGVLPAGVNQGRHRPADETAVPVDAVKEDGRF